MKILIAGSNGMVGSTVTRYLIECGHEVIRLVRHKPGPGEVWWDPDAGEIDTAGLDGFDGVVHLASMPWPTRWTAKAKQQIRANRLKTNRLLAESLANCRRKPGVLVCASGMGFYPPSGDQIITEDSAGGTSWLATLQRDGEARHLPQSVDAPPHHTPPGVVRCSGLLARAYLTYSNEPCHRSLCALEIRGSNRYG